MNDFRHLSDDELAALMREDAEGAFDEIYHRYWDKLYYLAHRMVKSAAIAEEITQDTFMLFWMKRQTLKIQSLKPYLAAMLRYEVYRSLPDICEELKISPKTAEAHLTKALKAVRTSLSNVVYTLLF